MKRITFGILALAIGATCAPPFAHAATGTPGSGTLLQFDELRVMVPAGQPLPAPEAFEQQYASAEQTLKSQSRDQMNQRLAKLHSRFPDPDSIRHSVRRGQVLGGIEAGVGLAFFAAGMSGALPDIRIPESAVIGVGVGEGIHAEVQRKHLEHVQEAMQQYMQTAMALFSRPQLLHVSAFGDRLRVENADTGEIALVQPDRQRIVLLDPASKTYAVQPLDGNPFTQSKCDAMPLDVTSLGSTQVAGVPAQGYRFHERGNSPGGAAMDVTVTRYVSDYTLPAAAMNALLGVNCAPDSAAMRNAPGGADHLAVYTGFAHAAPDQAAEQGLPPGMAGMMSPQFALWRGHLRTAPADPALFEIPAGYSPAPPAPSPASTAATADNSN